ncbi:hypothetical protein [Corynebacterium hiratae]|uniref:Uncharacterized protein n=1 Tax=Corynebacterium aurimucosum TaxID=169292 RepID=A0A6I3K8X2_9CORY|nr:hypothetical protein [Corynebacterium aurimucosum]MTD91134.1 hypothetical protein [Corynebacterium aurimucosum]
MTDLSTANLKRLLAETTPGPWEARGYYMDGEPRPDDSHQIRSADGEYLGIMYASDAILTAAAPQLAQEVLRLREELIDWANDEALAHNALVKRAQEAGGAGIVSTRETTYNRILEILGDHDG